MKYAYMTAAVLSFAAGAAQAQSNVTIFGLVDVGVRYITHANAAGSSLKSIGDGPLNGNRLGFKGTEDLGDGLQAIFLLEHGMAIDTGTVEQQGQFWGRQIWVGLSGKAGSVTFGRQYGVMHRAVGAFDPLVHGNIATENAPQILLEGVRFDNSLVYVGTVGNVQFGAMYALGEQAAGASRGRTIGAFGTAPVGPVTLSAGLQTSTDANEKDVKVFALGGTFSADPVKLYLGYVDAKRDAGFAAGANLSGTALANTSLIPAFNTLAVTGTAGTVTASRNDKLLITGASWRTSSLTNVIFGAYHDRISGDTVGAAGQRVSATRNTFYAVGQYFFSKRTDVYVEVDYNKYKDKSASGGVTGTGLNYNGFDSRTGVTLGMRHSW